MAFPKKERKRQLCSIGLLYKLNLRTTQVKQTCNSVLGAGITKKMAPVSSCTALW